ATVLPPRGVRGADEPEERLVNERGRLEGVPGPLPGQAGRRELAQLVVDEREQLGRRAAVAGRGGVQEAGPVGHCGEVYRLFGSVTPAIRWFIRRPPVPGRLRTSTRCPTRSRARISGP